MIKIKKGEAPEFLLGETVKRRISLALQEKEKHDFQTYYYGNEKNVKPILKERYKSKCCYCERDEAGGVELQIDHFRSVKPPKECNQPQAKKEHKGYYWLGYEWTNLLLSCSTCNKHKSNSFPIENEDDRIYEPEYDSNGNLYCKANQSPLIDEKPLIFNPEIDNAFEHFNFEVDGKMIGLTSKGKTTVELLKLSDSPLLIARNRIVNTYIKKFLEHLDAFRSKAIGKIALRHYFSLIFRSLKYSRNRSNTHTLFSYYFYQNFESIINHRIDIENIDKEQIIKAYRKFKEGKL